MSKQEKRKTLVILGAGATTGSGFTLKNGKEIPLDHNFFKKVKDMNCLNTDLFKYRKERQKDYQKVLFKSFDYFWKKYGQKRGIGLEEMWNTIVMHTKYIEQNVVRLNADSLFKGLKTISASPSVKIVRWGDFYMRILIQKVFGEEVNYEKEINKDKDSFTNFFNVINLKENVSDVSFISFNYDLCLEKKLFKNDIPFFYSNFTDEMGDRGVQVMKPHGSLNWWHGFDGFIRLKETNIYHPIKIGENNYHLEHTPESYAQYQPAIIPPDLLKEELFNEVGQTRLHNHFIHIGAQVGKAVQNADVIIIIGYRFPDADPHIRFLMRGGVNGIFDNQESKMKKVFAVLKNNIDNEDLNKKNDDRYSELLKSLFDTEPTLEICGFEKSIDRLKTWYSQSTK